MPNGSIHYPFGQPTPQTPAQDPDFVAFLAAVTANGGTISAPSQAAVAAFVRSIKNAGVWSSLNFLWVPVGDFLAMPVALKPGPISGGKIVNHAFLSGDWSESTGLDTGSSNTTKWIDTGYAASNLGAQNLTIGAMTTSALGNGTWFSIDDGSTANRVLVNGRPLVGFFSNSALSQSNTGGQVNVDQGVAAVCVDGTQLAYYKDAAICQDPTGSFTVPVAACGNLQLCKGVGIINGTWKPCGAFAGANMARSLIDAFGFNYRILATALGRDAGATGTDVFFGDSITFGNFATTNPWTTQVAANNNHRAINMGFSGSFMTHSTVGGGIESIRYQAELLAWESAYKPNYYILYGQNDKVNAITAATFQTSLTTVVAYLIAQGVSLSRIIIGSTPYGTADGTNDPTNAYPAACLAVANAKHTKYADVRAAMVAAGGDTVMQDALHPNQTGVDAIATAFKSPTQQ